MSTVVIDPQETPGGALVNVGGENAGLLLEWEAGAGATTFAFALTGKELLLVRNTHASASRALVLSGAADSLGRSTTLSESIDAGDLQVYGPFPIKGWRGTDGYLSFTMAADLEAAVLLLP